MKHLLTLLLLTSCIITSCGQSTKSSPAPFLTKTEMLADYDTLCSALKEAHGGLYRYKTKDQIDQHFATYRSRIHDKLDKYGFISLLMEMLADIGDGHMRLEYDTATMGAYTRAKTFPFRMVIEDGKLIALYNDSPGDTTIKPGMEIMEINGRKPADIIRTILPKLSTDGVIETGRKRRLERNFAFGYWLFIEPVEKFSIKAKDNNRKIITQEMPGVTVAEREANRVKNPVNEQLLSQLNKLDGPKENISLQFINDSVAAIKVRNFVDGDFLSSLDNIFLQAAKAKVMILDIRGNGGGRDQWGAYLVGKFMNKPFRYFDRIHIRTITPSFTTFRQETLDNLKKNTVADPNGGFLVTEKLHDGVAVQAPSNKPFTGKLLVLTDGLTFSTAADVAAQLRNRPNTIFIGEETGGGYEGNTSGMNAQLNLPHSGFSLRIQMYDYWNNVPAPAIKGRGIMPDHPVENKIMEIVQGIDSQWNFALKLANGK